MEFVAPLALFAFFAGVLVLMGRERGPLKGELGGPTVDERRVVRHIIAVFLTAWAIGAVAMLGPEELRPLNAVAGILIVLCGVAVWTDYRRVRAALRRDEQNAGLGNRWAAAAMVVIGLGWVGVGIEAALT